MKCIAKTVLITVYMGAVITLVLNQLLAQKLGPLHTCPRNHEPAFRLAPCRWLCGATRKGRDGMTTTLVTRKSSLKFAPGSPWCINSGTRKLARLGQLPSVQEHFRDRGQEASLRPTDLVHLQQPIHRLGRMSDSCMSGWSLWSSPATLTPLSVSKAKGRR